MTVELQKTVVVLARYDVVEAMRVAAGISIFDHKVNVILTHGQLQINDDVIENAELLEMSEVDVYSLSDDPEVPRIEFDKFGSLVKEAHFVLTI